MLTFDATGREVCTARRERTATPLQALVLLNDPQFIESARVLAEALLRQPDSSPESRIRSAFRILTSRQPSAEELRILIQLERDQRAHFTAVPDAGREFLAIGEKPRDEKLDVPELASLAIVIETLLSFEECVTKR